MLHISKPAAYVVLGISIGLEIVGSACIEACEQFTNIPLTILLIACLGLSYFLFSKILHIINLGVAYATWTSVGSIVTALIGVTLFKQNLNWIGWAAIIGMAIGVFFLNLKGTPVEEEVE